MRRNRLYQSDDDDMFSPGTDLIISLLAILLIVIAIGTKIYNNVVIENQQLLDTIGNKDREIRDKEGEIEDLKDRLAGAEGELNKIKKTSFPPNVIIAGAGEYAFPSNKAELTEELKGFINNKLVDIIEDNFNNYNINVIEVIGHTDGQPLGDKSSSNLDTMLEQVDANGIMNVNKLKAASNTDLGLMRALAVVTELQRIQKEEGRLKQVNSQSGFRAYSAAQLTLRNGAFASSKSEKDAPERRRIEIRFTRFRPEEINEYGQ